MRGSDLGSVFPFLLMCAFLGPGDPKPKRRPILKIIATLFIVMAVYTAGFWSGRERGWKPVPPQFMLGPAPVFSGAAERKGYWYSWYHNDKGELLFKRGGSSNVRLQIRYPDGTTEEI